MARLCFDDVSTSVVRMVSIIAAAEVMRWDMLTFSCESESTWDGDAVARAEEIGKKRSIEFKFYT